MHDAMGPNEEVHLSVGRQAISKNIFFPVRQFLPSQKEGTVVDIHQRSD